MRDIAVIDQSVSVLFLYILPFHIDENDTEAIEEFITAQGRHLSNCSWGMFDEEITDLRNE